MSLFVSLGLLLALGVTVLRLRPRPRNLAIKFCVDSVTCLEAISLGFWSGDERAMSVKISPPVRNASRPRSLAPLQSIGLTTRHKPLKNCHSRSLAEGRVEYRILVRYRYSYRYLPDGDSTARGDPSV